MKKIPIFLAPLGEQSKWIWNNENFTLPARKVWSFLRHSNLPHLFFAKKVFHYTTKGRNLYNKELTHIENAKKQTHKVQLFIFWHWVFCTMLHFLYKLIGCYITWILYHINCKKCLQMLEALNIKTSNPTSIKSYQI